MHRFVPVIAALVFTLSLFAGDVPLTNWPVPGGGGKVSSNADVSSGSIFVAVAPCRAVDTRLPAGLHGGPAISAGATRHFVIPTSPCTSIPSQASAFSLNVTILNYSASVAGSITVYPGGSTRPAIATVNFGGGHPISNAVVVGASTDGGISVYATHYTDVIIDVNGYYADGPTVLNPSANLVVQATVSDSGAIVGNNRAYTGTVYGVMGNLFSTGATNGSAGVAGYAPNGVSHGVKGTTDSGYNGAVGVFGITYQPVTGNSVPPVGIRGDSDMSYGVVGYSSHSSYAGVAGVSVNTLGATGNYGILGASSYGVFSGGNFAATGTKAFVDPHPTDATKVIRYVALEGPEAGTYFRGRGRIRGGKAVIEVPESFRLTTEAEGMTVHLTPVGGFAQLAVMQESLDGIVVQATRDVEFTYIVHGVRRGYAGFEAIGPGDEFRPRSAADTLPSHLNEEQKRRLVENGTYTSDGTVNLDTATRLRWDEAWREKVEKAREPRQK